MEIDDGRIKPTSKVEAIAYYRFLKHHEKKRVGNPRQVAIPEVGEWLSTIDSYRLFCSMERSVYQGIDIKPEQAMSRVAIQSLKQMAQSALGGCQAEVDNFDLMAMEQIEQGKGSTVVRLASMCVTLGE